MAKSQYIINTGNWIDFNSTATSTTWADYLVAPKLANPTPTDEESKHWLVMRDQDPDAEAYWAAVEYFRLSLPPSPWVVSRRPAIGCTGQSLFPAGQWLCTRCKKHFLALYPVDDGVTLERGMEYHCPYGPCRIYKDGKTVEACPATWLPVRSKSSPSLDSQRDKARKAVAQLWIEEWMDKTRAYNWLAQHLGLTHVSCWHLNPEQCGRVVRLVEWYLLGGEGDKP
jgi:hypothetical protein